MQNLTAAGFDDFFQAQLQPGTKSLVPARVLSVQRGRYQLLTEDGQGPAVLSGRLEYVFQSQVDFPGVGDFVMIRQDDQNLMVIEQVLDRRSAILRKQVGKSSAGQMIAANVDFGWIVQSCNQDFNLRRLERYLTALVGTGVKAVIVLTKSDLLSAEERQHLLTSVEQSAGADASIHFVSSLEGEGLDQLTPYLEAGKTSVLIGSSGVGKSTLIKKICPEVQQAIQASRESDGKGRHTTTSRELFFTPYGGMIIDTPGMREFGLVDGDGADGKLFLELESLATQCRFRNCSHENEPGCAILAAIATGALDKGRLESMKKLAKEQAFQQRRTDARLNTDTKKRWKKITKMMRNRQNPKT